MKYLLTFSIISMLMNSCVKKECMIAGGYYQFEIPVSLTPAKDTFHIGDTISIESNFSDLVYERMTDKKYKLENFNFYPETSIYRLDTNVIVDDFSGFEVVVPSHYDYSFYDYSSGVRALTGKYNYVDGFYDLAYKLIPQKTGLYFFRHFSFISLGENQEFEGKCSEVADDVFVLLNQGDDNNVDYLLEGADDFYGNFWRKKEDKFFKAGGYCFYVVE